MNFYIYQQEENGQEMLASVQRLVSETGLSASIYVYDASEKLPEHSFDLFPALFIDGNLLIEGDVPSYDELCMLIGVAFQVYGYASGGGCSSGGCSSGGCSGGGCGGSAQEEILDEAGSCDCGGNCTCDGTGSCSSS